MIDFHGHHFHGHQTRTILGELAEPHIDWMLSGALLLVAVILICIALLVEDRALKAFALGYVTLPI